MKIKTVRNNTVKNKPFIQLIITLTFHSRTLHIKGSEHFIPFIISIIQEDVQ